MAWQGIALVVVAFAGAFIFVPHSIMLATSNRTGLRFASFQGKFHFTAASRLAVTIAGAAMTLTFAFLEDALAAAVLFGLSLFALYLLDFRQSERISRDLTDAA